MQDKLQELLDLTKNEMKVYMVLLSTPDADPLDISNETKLARTRVYEVQSKLVSKGLLEKNGSKYHVIPPQIALESIQEKLKVQTQCKIDALRELSPHMTEMWREGAVDVVTPGVEIFSYADIESSYLKEMKNIQKRVFIAASSTTGGIDWKRSAENLAEAYKKDLDIRYLYAEHKMVERMTYAFKYYVPFKNLKIKIRSNEELTSSFILLDNKLYIFFMATDTFTTKVLSVISTEMVNTFEWLYTKLWDEAES